MEKQNFGAKRNSGIGENVVYPKSFPLAKRIAKPGVLCYHAGAVVGSGLNTPLVL